MRTTDHGELYTAGTRGCTSDVQGDLVRHLVRLWSGGAFGLVGPQSGDSPLCLHPRARDSLLKVLGGPAARLSGASTLGTIASLNQRARFNRLNPIR